jgi:hypothetical protein
MTGHCPACGNTACVCCPGCRRPACICPDLAIAEHLDREPDADEEDDEWRQSIW